jgi:hypothetical protein
VHRGTPVEKHCHKDFWFVYDAVCPKDCVFIIASQIQCVSGI